jgi:hypothetical protein
VEGNAPPTWAELLGPVATAKDKPSLLAAMRVTERDLAERNLADKPFPALRRHFVKELCRSAGKLPPPAEEPIAPPPPTRASRSISRVRALKTSVDGVLPIRFDMDVYAAITVIEELAPKTLGRALELCGVTASELDGIKRTWDERLDAPHAGAEFAVCRIDHRVVFKQMLEGATPVLVASAESYAGV